MALSDILQDFVNEEYDNLLGMAKQAIADILPVFNDLAKDGDGATGLIALFATSLAVDGKLSELEYKFVCDLLGDKSFDEVKALVAAHYNAETFDLVDKLVDEFPVDMKSKLLTFCCCFLAVDEKISREEVAFVTKLCQ